MLEVTLYRKPGCSLCDHAEDILARLGKRLPIRITLVDIDRDPTLQARYFLEIPVVAVGDEEIARAPISERALRDILESLAEAEKRCD